MFLASYKFHVFFLFHTEISSIPAVVVVQISSKTILRIISNDDILLSIVTFPSVLSHGGKHFNPDETLLFDVNSSIVYCSFTHVMK